MTAPVRSASFILRPPESVNAILSKKLPRRSDFPIPPDCRAFSMSSAPATSPAGGDLLAGWRALCVDLDGTLAEVERRRARLWPQLFRSPRILLGLSPALRSLRGRRHRDLDAALAEALAVRTGAAPAATRPTSDALLRQHWPATFHDAQPPAAVAALLAAARTAGLPTAVFSDHPALEKLRQMGAEGWDAVVDGHALGALKPLPDGLHAVAAQLGQPVHRMLFVGDREDTDGRAAAASGAGFLSVTDLARLLGPGALSGHRQAHDNGVRG